MPFNIWCSHPLSWILIWTFYNIWLCPSLMANWSHWTPCILLTQLVKLWRTQISPFSTVCKRNPNLIWIFYLLNFLSQNAALFLDSATCSLFKITRSAFGIALRISNWLDLAGFGEWTCVYHEGLKYGLTPGLCPVPPCLLLCTPRAVVRFKREATLWISLTALPYLLYFRVWFDHGCALPAPVKWSDKNFLPITKTKELRTDCGWLVMANQIR